ncbi:MAG TPA: peptidoglycan-binding protein [Ardenticatenaceae bacterium]
MAEIKRGDPALHNRLGTSGMLCVRRIANSPNTSNHSWGIAVDLKVDGRVDPPGNGRTFPELLEISSIFNRHGWYWGAEFPHEDAMHFEISLERMQQWHDDGRFKRDPVLQHGHFGNKVAELQNLLNGSGVTPSVLAVDKDFGDRTLVAVKAFQEARGLVVDGIVGRNTWAALRA